MTSGVVSPQRANPSLRCSHTFADSLAAALCGTQPSPADGRFAGPSLTVWVDWGSLTEAEPGPFTLTARYEGEQLLQEHVDASHQELMLSLSIAGFTYGSTIHCELCWPSGARHLHVMRPLEPSCLAFGGLVSVAPSAADIAAAELSPSMVANIRTMPASCWWRSISTATLEVETLCAPVRPLRLSSVERGLGVEIELVTLAGPGRPGKLTLVNPGVGATLDAIAERCVTSSPEAMAILRRCLRWPVGDDIAIRPALANAASRSMEACAIAADDEAQALTLLSATSQLTHKTELRSPAPPCELSFSDGAADEIRCMLQMIKRAGAAATSICRTHTTLLTDADCACDSGTAVHVHVNVRNAEAEGELLSARELLRVVLAWVRFDLVTSRFARAWMWREPSCAPLFATGAEFTRSEAVEHADDDESRTGEQTPGAEEWDVPAFFVRVHALLHSADFRALSDHEQVRRLFGEDSPGRGLGRYCSLNVQSLMKYGTLEMRRFHSTLDGDLIAHWAHLCVSFVEVFRHGPAEEAVLAMPLVDEALATLQAAQERATVSELMYLLRDYVDGATGEMLVAEAAGAH